MQSYKKYIPRFTAVWILATGFVLQAQGGTIDGDTTQGWSQVASLPASLDQFPAASFNGAMYTIGGYDGAAKTNVYCYDGTS